MRVTSSPAATVSRSSESKPAVAAKPAVENKSAVEARHVPGHSKADWSTQLFDYLDRQGDVRGVLWFHERKERDWRVDSSPAAETAYRRAVAKLR